MKKISKTILMSSAFSLVLPTSFFASFNSAYASLIEKFGTPIGIEIGSGHYVALEESSSLPWGGYDIDIPNLDEKASNYNGLEPTKIILAYGQENNISYPAAEYAHNYAPAACAPGSWCGSGNWYLPGDGELSRLFRQNAYGISYWDVASGVKATLKFLNLPELRGQYWTSTEATYDPATKATKIYGGTHSNVKKTDSYRVRPFLRR